MKKIIFIILIVIFIILNISQPKEIIIPQDSIRFRIIANSNSQIDQDIKKNIKKDLEKNFFTKLNNAKSLSETRQLITDNQSELENLLNKYNLNYHISFGQNYFPKKEYKGVTYEAGNYESLVISLGEAQGANWWCVMYPPLCMLESNSNNYEEIEYKLYIEEVLERLFS